jgi:hypothetical protein
MNSQITELRLKVDEQQSQIRSLEIDVQKAKNLSYRFGIKLATFCDSIEDPLQIWIGRISRQN